MGRVREIRRLRRLVRIGVPDPSVTRFSGMVAVTELLDRLNMIKLLDAAIGPIKQRDRGFSAGELLVGMACAQLAGEEFLPPTRGPGAAGPCTPTSARCRSTSSPTPTPTPSTATRSSSPTSTSRPARRPPRSSTGTDTAPRSRTSSGTPSSARGCVISPPDIPRSTPRGCGERCSRPASPAGCTSSPRPPEPAGQLFGHGVRGGQAMIATLRHRLICARPAYPPRPRRRATPTPRPRVCSTRSSPASARYPPRPDPAVPAPTPLRNPLTRGDTRAHGPATNHRSQQ